ncbi:MAG: class I SAM-dependent methyltransferase [Candidatus Omnitrophota bacterium]|nr:class I SAM-dependent methyltransferase [Candidatus Omnitrophota bacterium]
MLRSKHNLSLFKAILITIAFCLLIKDSCYGLSPIPASQNPSIKRKVYYALAHSEVRYAESEYAKGLLKANNTSCLLLPSGKYLVNEEIANDEIKLLRAMNHEDIEALMQIISVNDRSRYQGLKELMLKYFPPGEDNILPIDLYVNHLVASAFELLLLIEDGLIFEDEIPFNQRKFLKRISSIINHNRHNYFTQEFWDIVKRKERIRLARDNGMRFYQAAHSEFINRRKGFYDIARRFRKGWEEKDICFNRSYDEIIAEILERSGIQICDENEDPEEVLIRALRMNNIKRILEIGCGSCAFILAISGVAERAGCEVVGIDRKPVLQGSRQSDLEKRKVKILKEDVRKLNDAKGFDMIIASGVMSFGGAYSQEMADMLKGQGCFTKDELRETIRNAEEMAEKAVSLLSDHPKAALFTNTFRSTLMLFKKNISSFAKIEVWDNSRKGDHCRTYDAVLDGIGKKIWMNLWRQAASFAVLTKEANTVRRLARDISYEIGEMEILALDFMHSQVQNGDTYRIKYDESRLDEDQIRIIRLYAEILEKKSSAKFRLIPFSREKGSTESLIAIYRTGKGGNGEGHIDVVLPEERFLAEYSLRIITMLNMAIAASNIPDIADNEQLERYNSLIRYIYQHCETITGHKFTVPTSLEELLNSIRWIILDLPESGRMPFSEIVEYNELAIEALTAV